jgi:multimeric flavodoxin WrbA
VKCLLIIYHSQSGSTESLAAAVYRGAVREEGVTTRIVRAQAAGLADLLACDALLIGSPENFGFMAGAVKDFFDRTYYPAQARGVLLPYALFISAGNDGTGAVRQIERIAYGYPLKKIAEPVICRGPINTDAQQRCADLGEAVATGLALGIY